MLRAVCDLGDSHLRIQAPEGWVAVEARGSRVILRDANCPAPIFVEPLHGVDDIDHWIGGVVTAKARLSRHQQSSKPDARRFVVTITSRAGVVERAYHLQRVPTTRSKEVWVAASVDLDGDAARARLLTQAFPGLTQIPNVSGESGLRQFIEDGFTLKLPRGYTVAEATGTRVLLREGAAPFGWLTCARLAVDDPTVTATIDELIAQRGAIAERFSETTRSVMVPVAENQVQECTLWVAADAASHLVFSLEKLGGRDQLLDLLRRLARGVRLWAGGFQGYWTPPHSRSWTDFTPPPHAPPPAPVRPPTPAVTPPPAPDLRTEWTQRLSGAVLHYKSSPSRASQPRGFYGGDREVTIGLLSDGTVTWEESGFVSTTLPGVSGMSGMYSGGHYAKRQSGTWIVQGLDASAWLVLHLSKDGRHRLALGRSGDKVTLDGVAYSIAKY